MIYSHEVEMMCPVAQGANHGRGSDSGRSKMGESERSKGYFRFDTWCWLVCSAAGYM